MGTADITDFGTASTGATVQKITLRSNALTVSLLTWGATVQDLRLAGVARSLTLGSDDIADYEGPMRHHGSLIGPIVNRISTGRVQIAGMVYELERNQDGRIHLHSGAQATHRQNWDIVDASDSHATLRIALGDGDCGLPGNRTITATFRVTGATLDLQINGTTDAETLMNCANHSYWNFDGTPTWDGHRLRVLAETYLPGTADATPTGEVVACAGTAMDFATQRRIAPQDPPFDNNFCLSDGPAPLRDVLWLTGASGVGMVVATDQAGIQVYDGRAARRPGHGTYEGLAIEAQGWPDAPTHRHFPSIKITPAAPYSQHTRYTFVENATK